MHITFQPLRQDTPLTLERQGDTLVINGKALDLANLPEGSLLPADAVDSPFVTGPISRQEGKLYLSLVLPHGAVAPHNTRFPAPLEINEDGPVNLPPYEETPNV